MDFEPSEEMSVMLAMVDDFMRRETTMPGSRTPGRGRGDVRRQQGRARDEPRIWAGSIAFCRPASCTHTSSTPSIEGWPVIAGYDVAFPSGGRS